MRELPARAKVIGWSEKTKVEMFRRGEHIMGIQGHPEYNKDILFHLLDRLRQKGLIQVSLIIISLIVIINTFIFGLHSAGSSCGVGQGQHASRRTGQGRVAAPLPGIPQGFIQLLSRIEQRSTTSSSKWSGRYFAGGDVIFPAKDYSL